jgi:hypothetical protein
MALIPQKSRPASTNVTRERIGPNRVTADRSVLAMAAPYPRNKSTNTSNKQAQIIDCVLIATYQPAAAPTQLTGMLTHTLNMWNITASESGRAPDILPGDVLEFLSQDDPNQAVVDALTNSGLLVVGVYMLGSNPYDLGLLLYNNTGGTLSTPASYNPTILISRFTNLSTDPNPIP